MSDVPKKNVSVYQVLLQNQATKEETPVDIAVMPLEPSITTVEAAQEYIDQKMLAGGQWAKDYWRLIAKAAEAELGPDAIPSTITAVIVRKGKPYAIYTAINPKQLGTDAVSNFLLALGKQLLNEAGWVKENGRVLGALVTTLGRADSKRDVNIPEGVFVSKVKANGARSAFFMGCAVREWEAEEDEHEFSLTLTKSQIVWLAMKEEVDEAGNAGLYLPYEYNVWGLEMHTAGEDITGLHFIPPASTVAPTVH